MHRAAVLAYLGNIGTQAALIAGFVFSCFVEGFPGGQLEGSSNMTELTYMGLCTLCIGMMMYTVICSTLTTSLAPSMALKGKEGSAMRLAVEHMKNDRRSIMVAFAVGSVAFNAVVVCMIWIKLEWLGTQVVCTIIFTACSFWCLGGARSIINQYTLPDSDSSIPGARVVTGAEFLRKACGTDDGTLTQLARASKASRIGRLRLRSTSGPSPARDRPSGARRGVTLAPAAASAAAAPAASAPAASALRR